MVSTYIQKGKKIHGKKWPNIARFQRKKKFQITKFL
jgi:hypothetical protein